MTLPSRAGSGRSFPFAGGSSVKSTNSPARIRSQIFWGTAGKPWTARGWWNVALPFSPRAWFPLGILLRSWLSPGRELVFSASVASRISGGGGRSMVLRDVGRLPGGGKVPNLGVLDPGSGKGAKNDCCLFFFVCLFLHVCVCVCLLFAC